MPEQQYHRITQAIIDIKGVIYEDGKRETPGQQPPKELCRGAVEFVAAIDNLCLPYVFATNTTSELPEDILEDLEKQGLHLNRERMVTAITLSLEYLKRWNHTRIYLVSDNPKLRQLYVDGGIEITEGFVDSPVHAVVVGLDRIFNQDTRDKAVNHVESGAKLIALNDNAKRSSSKPGYRIEENAGAQADYIKKISGVSDMTLIGKPSRDFYESAMGLLPEATDYRHTLVVGDDPQVDLVEAVRQFRVRSGWIRSRKYPEYPNEREIGGFNPDYKFDSLEELMFTLESCMRVQE